MPVIERIEEESSTEQPSPAPLPPIVQEAASYKGRMPAPAPAAGAAESAPAAAGSTASVLAPTAAAAEHAPTAAAPRTDHTKAINDEIVRVISNTFLEFRKKVTAMFKPEVGVIDDMIVTWQNRYLPRVAAQAAAAATSASDGGDQAKSIKEGKLNVVLYLKTIPDEKTGTQGYNSFTIDAKMNFTSDTHPAIEMEATAAAAATATKKKSEEVASAAQAAAASDAPAAAAAAPQAAAEEKTMGADLL